VSGVTQGGSGASGVDGEVDACPAAVGKGREVGSKPAGGRAVGDFSGLVGGSLYGSTGARVPWGRERLGRERADGFDPDSVLGGRAAVGSQWDLHVRHG
jgi:hypothetical protein